MELLFNEPGVKLLDDLVYVQEECNIEVYSQLQTLTLLTSAALLDVS